MNLCCWSVQRWVVFVLCIVCILKRSNAVGPDGRSKVLVIGSSKSDLQQYTSIISTLKDREYEVEIRTTDKRDAVLMKDGAYLYDSVLIFAPAAENFGDGISSVSLMEFIESGGSLLIAADLGYSTVTKKIASGIGIELDCTECSVIDHASFDAVLDDGSHTIVEAGGRVESVPFDSSVSRDAKIVFRGVGAALFSGNELVDAVAWASDNAYSFSAKEEVDEVPFATGKDIVLAAALQTRHAGRALYLGGLFGISDEVMLDKSRSDHSQYFRNLILWVCGESGVLKSEFPRHRSVATLAQLHTYRVMDDIEFMVDVYEWNGTSHSWNPFLATDMQIEFTMLNPYARTRLRADGNGTVRATVGIPDVLGIYKFEVEYIRPGYSQISFTENVNVRPFWHNEYERFIPQAFPYYISSFLMLSGVLGFGLIFLFGQPSIQSSKPQSNKK